ncbi:MAG: hypothetical protein WD670_04220, partial [Actinomycetota bacterium]
WLSLGLVVGVFGQAVVGGVVVLTDLHPAAVQQHFLLSMVTIVNATVLVRRAGEPDRVAASGARIQPRRELGELGRAVFDHRDASSDRSSVTVEDALH